MMLNEKSMIHIQHDLHYVCVYMYIKIYKTRGIYNKPLTVVISGW